MPKALKIAYLGPAGTFTEQAARQLGADSELHPVASVTEAMDAVLAGQADRAVVPIENSIEGGVSATSDALAVMPGVQIFGEYLVPVRFDLMAKPGTKLADVKDVLTHPVAYAQSRKWLEHNLSSHTHIPAASTAAAAKALADGANADAVIAASGAAKLYGLEILASDIGENKEAQTRFIEIGKKSKPQPKTGADKTSVIVELPDDRPGGLLEMLEQFAARGVNLSRIESRPVGDRFGRYRFNIDAEGHIEDEAIAEALMGLHRFSPKVIFLGSYAKADKSASEHQGNNANTSYHAARKWLDDLRG
ncbi:MAG: prephenate dehydratase [Actinomycetota bacterium]|jgi:prephenate dehydratase